MRIYSVLISILLSILVTSCQNIVPVILLDNCPFQMTAYVIAYPKEFNNKTQLCITLKNVSGDHIAFRIRTIRCEYIPENKENLNEYEYWGEPTMTRPFYDGFTVLGPTVDKPMLDTIPANGYKCFTKIELMNDLSKYLTGTFVVHVNGETFYTKLGSFFVEYKAQGQDLIIKRTELNDFDFIGNFPVVIRSRDGEKLSSEK